MTSYYHEIWDERYLLATNFTGNELGETDIKRLDIVERLKHP